MFSAKYRLNLLKITALTVAAAFSLTSTGWDASFLTNKASLAPRSMFASPNNKLSRDIKSQQAIKIEITSRMGASGRLNRLLVEMEIAERLNSGEDPNGIAKELADKILEAIHSEEDPLIAELTERVEEIEGKNRILSSSDAILLRASEKLFPRINAALTRRRFLGIAGGAFGGFMLGALVPKPIVSVAKSIIVPDLTASLRGRLAHDIAMRASYMFARTDFMASVRREYIGIGEVLGEGELSVRQLQIMPGMQQEVLSTLAKDPRVRWGMPEGVINDVSYNFDASFMQRAHTEAFAKLATANAEIAAAGKPEPPTNDSGTSNNAEGPGIKGDGLTNLKDNLSPKNEALSKGVSLKSHNLISRLETLLKHKGEAYQQAVYGDRIFIVEADIETPLIKAWQREHFFMQIDGRFYLYGPMLKRLPVNERCKLVLAAADSVVEGKALEENEVWKKAERDFNLFLREQARKAARSKKKEPEKSQNAEPDKRSQCVRELTALLDSRLEELKKEIPAKEKEGLRFSLPSESGVKVLRQEIEAVNPLKPKRIEDIKAKIEALDIKFERTLPLFPKTAQPVSLTSLPGIQAALDECEASIMTVINLSSYNLGILHATEGLLAHIKKGKEKGISREWTIEGEHKLDELRRVGYAYFETFVDKKIHLKEKAELPGFVIPTEVLQAQLATFRAALDSALHLENGNLEYVDALVVAINQEIRRNPERFEELTEERLFSMWQRVHRALLDEKGKADFAKGSWDKRRSSELASYFSAARKAQNAAIKRFDEFISMENQHLAIDDMKEELKKEEITIVPTDEGGRANYFMIYMVYVISVYSERPENYRRYLVSRKEEIEKRAQGEKEKDEIKMCENKEALKRTKESWKKTLLKLIRLTRTGNNVESFNSTLSQYEICYLMRVLEAILENFPNIEPSAVDELYNALKNRQFRIKTIAKKSEELNRFKRRAQWILGCGLPISFAALAYIRGYTMVIDLILMVLSPFLVLGAFSLYYRIALTWHVAKVEAVLKEELMQALRKTDGVSPEELSRFEASGVFCFKPEDMKPLPADSFEKPASIQDLGGAKPQPAPENTSSRQSA